MTARDVSDDRLAERLRMLRQRLMAVFSASYVPASVRDTIPALNEAADALDEAAAEVGELREALDAEKQSADRIVADLTAEVERLRAETATDRSALRIATERARTAEAEVERLRAALNETQRVTERQTAKRKQAVKRRDALLAEVNALRARLAEQSDELATALAQLTALRGVQDAVQVLCDRLLRESGVGPYETGVSVGDVLDAAALGDTPGEAHGVWRGETSLDRPSDTPGEAQ